MEFIDLFFLRLRVSKSIKKKNSRIDDSMFSFKDGFSNHTGGL